MPSSFTAATVDDLINDINAANLIGGANTINLVAGHTFTLTAAINTPDGANALPVIVANDNLTIVGNGDIIERSTTKGTSVFRLFDVAAGASLSLSDVTLQGGLAYNSGGAIMNQGTLSLSGVIVQRNTVQGTDGLSILGFSFPGGPAAGGAIYSLSGALTIDGCTIQNNLATGGNGMDSTNSGAPVPSYMNGGDAFGGGVYVAGGTATIVNSTITGNVAQGGHGGSASTGPNGGGHGGHNGGGGGVVYIDSGATSTASGSGGGAGGAGGSAYGGGLHATGAAVTLSNDTVISNQAAGGAGGNGTTGHPDGQTGVGIGGGLFIDPTATVSMDAFTVGHVKRNHASTSDDDIHGSYGMMP